MTPFAIAGQALLWLGFLGGALASVFRLENADAPWQTIPWGMYALCAAVGVAGVFLLRRDQAARRNEAAGSESQLETVKAALTTASERVQALRQGIDDRTCEEVLDYIDQECGPLLTEFADGRQVITNRFGTAAFAAVMTEFASGERYLNRAWSAAADGYVDEVEISVGHAGDFLAAAVQELNTAEGN